MRITNDQKNALKALVAFALIYVSAFILPALVLVLWFEFFVEVD